MKRYLMILASLAACTDEAGGEAEPPRAEVTAFVRGRLAGSLTDANALHDQIAAGGHPTATSLGDLGHGVFLGTGDTGRPADEFVALDQWTTAEGATMLYGDPNFQAGFSQLFAEPVMPALYQRAHDWHQWGDLPSQDDSTPVWIMVVRGKLRSTNLEENRAAHDRVAAGFQAQAEAAGDIAHVPHIDVNDPRMFFNIDVATSREAHLATLQNPQFGEAFGALFEGQPDVAIYRSTDWYQW